MTRQTLLVLLAAFAASAGRAADDDWPRFRGPNGTGISPAVTIPVRWTPDDYNWKVPIPGLGHSSPVLWGKRLFLTSADPQTATRRVMCIDVSDGRTLWQREYPSKPYEQNADNSYATATPAADAAGVVVTWTTPEEIVVLALDSDGRETWRRGLGPLVAKHGSGSSPIIVGDMVILANDQEDPARMPGTKSREAGRSSVIALDRRTGATRWQTDRRTALAAYSTPCLYRRPDGADELIFTSTAHGVTAADPARGKVTWEMPDVFRDRCVGSPVVTADLVIAAYGYGSRGTRLVAVRPAAAEGRSGPTLAYDVTRSVPLVPTPIVIGDRLFLWADDGTVSCLVAATGETVWRERVGGAFYSSPVWAAGRLYCVARNGEVVVIAAADKFEILARVPLGEQCYATPAIADGVMYLRTFGHLYSLGGRKR